MWGRIVNTLLGLWLIVAPAIGNYSSAATDNGHIVGPIIATISVIAYWEATRGMRTCNYPIAFWLLAAPWVLGYTSTFAIVSDMGTGVLVFLFASVKGKVESSYGGGWASLIQDNPEHLQKSKKSDQSL